MLVQNKSLNLSHFCLFVFYTDQPIHLMHRNFARLKSWLDPVHTGYKFLEDPD